MNSLNHGKIISIDLESDRGILQDADTQDFYTFSSDSFGKVEPSQDTLHTTPVLSKLSLLDTGVFFPGQMVLYTLDHGGSEHDVALMVDTNTYNNVKKSIPQDENFITQIVETLSIEDPSSYMLGLLNLVIKS